MTILFIFLGLYLSLATCTSLEQSFISKLKCDLCQDVIKKADKLIAENSTTVDVEDIATLLCELDSAGGECEGPAHSWQCEQLCKLAIQTYVTTTDDLVLRYLDPSVICYTIENNTFDCPPPIEPDPTPVPNVIGDDPSHLPYNISDTHGYILHIPDLHWDMQYAPDSVANCGEPVCCRSYDNDHSYPYPVLYGGMYGINNENTTCDAPRTLTESAVQFIEQGIILNNSEGINADNLDFIVFVGDIEAHDVYNQSQKSHLTVMESWLKLLHDTLDEYNIPILFDLGNHEGLPVNNFGGPGIDNWLNTPLAQWLTQWIDTPYSVQYDTKKPSDILSFSGYYTSLIRPGFRLVSINTGYIDSDNFYLKFTEFKPPKASYVDIGGQYKWLKEILYRAKYVLNETIVIAQHHPFHSAVEQFATLYYDLYTEYQDIIMVILAGHTHVDEYHIFGNSDFGSTGDNKPYTTWFSPGSITPIGGRNPAFRVYKYDRRNYELVNYYQYRFDLEKSNMDKKPCWFLAYDAVSEYGMKDISAQSMSDLAYAMATNDTLWNRYEYNYFNGVKRSSPAHRNATICNLLSATEQQRNDCNNNLFKSSISYQQLY
eukprot:109888_1